eukprot:CAMPEP_0118967448 /NCGR_PEP_ID=MMETSP1173-20130426/4838_1 /TAXON_ID=1034831 /ORGANISM="Rhizochromulina marina cf, Strain CCMP1243" /LENGTH=62 /DNA_ID=CAMNT_0006916417 /DNA_START=371 /DNA_END=559 /DNA_ORIENTATION=-
MGIHAQFSEMAPPGNWDRALESWVPVKPDVAEMGKSGQFKVGNAASQIVDVQRHSMETFQSN